MMNLGDPASDFCLPKLTTLTTSGISLKRMCHLVSTRPTIKHVQMDSKTVIDKKNEAWLRAHTESFDFFDGSDDEDEDISVEGDAEGDAVPGDDDNLIDID